MKMEKNTQLRGKSEPSPRRSSASSRDSSGLKATPGMFVKFTKSSFKENYKAVKLLGKGSFGEVLLCIHRATGNQYAIKVISKNSLKKKGDHESLLREVNVLKDLDHPNIMKIFEFFEDEKYYYFVTELYSGGELFDEIVSRKRFSEYDAARITKQILSGITYMHRQNIVHRDLKPENLILESRVPNSNIRIIDFGLSTYYSDESKLKDKIGTAYYIAPEVLKGIYDQKCDIWSIGVILYILLSGFPPFNGASEAEIIKKVQAGKYSFEMSLWQKVSESAKDLIRRMLSYNPAKRISAAEALEHHWITFMTRDQQVDLPSLELSIDNMRNFHYSQKFSQAAMLYIGSKLLTRDESKSLTAIFNSMDKNGDGQLDRSELIEGYIEYLRIKGQAFETMDRSSVEEQVDLILQEIDFDNNGYIDYSEFLTVAMDRRTLFSKERLEKAFKLFDVDNSGTISCSELSRIFGITDLGTEQWQQLLKEVDTNNDGVIDFKEFKAMLTKYA
ncbi:protein kinase domain containing protein [Theileria equi strain WA]|uniref:non-specific serine/threonine protein kinase n=1 Tax=Theileria equi strain WA TaxID=1537102 RepID=L1LGF1_THEEQ|nr:protein kinase domain containing protein [Theileria equi strain WA]EKX74349.1 protein kinase domain containing protein [Theileria equi strain WA]|eukprot:XP_004833801.1 protein kinase domain containing protein [Theileria equi strain WA]